VFNANFSSISTISSSWCAKNIFGEKQKIKKINGMMGLKNINWIFLGQILCI
jgi:hypothetical protein